jgi:hypothetical protein
MLSVWVGPLCAKDDPDNPTPDRYESHIELTIPEGFAADPNEEPGIFKWRKANAELYIVIGELFADSWERLFDELRKSAATNERIEECRDLKIPGVKAFLYKEKPTDDSTAMKQWRLIAISKEKMYQVDMSAPEKSFPDFIADFETVVRTFKPKATASAGS